MPEATTTPEQEPTHPAVKTLLEKLDDIAEKAPYAADPREATAATAAALAEYFRSPD